MIFVELLFLDLREFSSNVFRFMPIYDLLDTLDVTFSIFEKKASKRILGLCALLSIKLQIIYSIKEPLSFERQ